MQLARLNFTHKRNAIATAVRNSSCSSGWLRLVVQSIFAVLTVVSFVLIVKLSWPRRVPPVAPGRYPRCGYTNCKVQCREAPYFKQYEDDIVQTVAEASDTCSRMRLLLELPMFVNDTMPAHFLSRLRYSIRAMCIIGGNLKRIPPNAFMSQYAGSISTLMFQRVSIDYWVPDSLVGLSNLKELYIKNCKFENIPTGILRAIDDTLETLTIRNSKNWNPVDFTGTSNFSSIHTVDFSSNFFGDILNRESFKGLATCKVLYLNSCQITYIGIGTFDHLTNIEVLFLNNNLLVNIPPGLFNMQMAITYPKPRINLHDNPWHCSCSIKDIKLLVVNDLLMVEPICNSPIEHKGKTFNELERYCCNDNNLLSKIDISNNLNIEYVTFQHDYVQMNEVCNDTRPLPNISLRVLSPEFNSNCASSSATNVNLLRSFVSQSLDHMPETRWLRVTYYLKTETYSMVQLDTPAISGHGLLWYQSSCPNEVFCINTLPRFLRVYNDDLSTNYTFCPVVIDSGTVEIDQCIVYNFFTEKTNGSTLVRYQLLVYLTIGLICLILGAFFLYALVLKHPTLLRGSKRILFVKHKAAEALVLPPKVPLRNDLSYDDTAWYSDDKIFVMPSTSKYSTLNQFNRNKSIRSNKSNAPSYISALQPTEDQLAEWRGRHPFDSDITLTSMTSDFSMVSWLYSEDSLVYSTEMDNEKTYESLK